MKLGNLLTASPAEPIVTWPVEFHVLRQGPDGLRRIRVKAWFMPVSEADRHKAEYEAAEFLRTHPESSYRQEDNKPVVFTPMGPLTAEKNYKLLSYALHDEENHRLIVDTVDYLMFRKGIVAEQASWLVEQYDKFIKQEYPEIVPPEQKNKLVDEATGK